MSTSLKEAIRQTQRALKEPIDKKYEWELEIERRELTKRGHIIPFPRLIGAQK